MAEPTESALQRLILQALEQIPEPSPATLWLGLSGGLDSVCLLAEAAALRAKLATIQLRAVHVNHGIQAASDQWQAHCERLCQQLGVPFTSCVVNLSDHQSSLEAAARAARYQAFSRQVAANDLLLLAHHRDDQVETFLQRAARGSGPLGLAAMVTYSERAGLRIVRPWLAADRQQIQQRAEALGLSWVEDPSNADLKHERNFLRQQILPQWRSSKQELNQTLSRAAKLCGESSNLLSDLATLDAGAELAQPQLAIDSLSPLSPARQRNLLRYWIQANGYPMPSEVRLERVLVEVLPARSDAQPRVDWGKVSIRRFRDKLYLVSSMVDQSPIATVCTSLVSLVAAGLTTELGILKFQQVPSKQDVSTEQPPQGSGPYWDLSQLSQRRIEIRFDRFSERLRPPKRPSKSVKDWFLEFGVPPWLRPHWPLLYLDDQLAGIPGLVVAEPYVARDLEQAGDCQWHWTPGKQFDSVDESDN